MYVKAAPVARPMRAVVVTIRMAGEEGVARKARRATAKAKMVKAVIVGLRSGLAMLRRSMSDSGTYT